MKNKVYAVGDFEKIFSRSLLSNNNYMQNKYTVEWKYDDKPLKQKDAPSILLAVLVRRPIFNWKI